MIERSPGDWTEENVGEKFLDLWRTLKSRLTKKNLPHYFIQKYNMFSNIPNHKLAQAQERVHRLTENPVMFLLRCLLNVQFEKNFYPRLDIEKLYKILTTDSALELMQPQLAGWHPPSSFHSLNCCIYLGCIVRRTQAGEDTEIPVRSREGGVGRRLSNEDEET